MPCVTHHNTRMNARPPETILQPCPRTQGAASHARRWVGMVRRSPGSIAYVLLKVVVLLVCACSCCCCCWMVLVRVLGLVIDLVGCLIAVGCCVCVSRCLPMPTASMRIIVNALPMGTH
eukprot:5697748-Alexandrium_andersonii.AAC.1